MKEILVLLVITGAFFIAFGITFITALVKKRRKLMLFSLVLFLSFMISGISLVYTLAAKSVHTVGSLLFDKPRTGQKIYTALFGKTPYACLKVVRYQDQTIPRLDDGIRLEVLTCPAEITRILQQKKFTAEKKIMIQKDHPDPVWFKPETLGNSIWVYTYYNEQRPGNSQTIYLSADSTKAFCVDIAD